MGASLEYKDLTLGSQAKKWIRSCSNKLGRLVQSVNRRILTALNTIHFVHPSENPTPRHTTYLRIVSELKPHKEGKYRARFTVGGNCINYLGVVTVPTVEL